MYKNETKNISEIKEFQYLVSLGKEISEDKIIKNKEDIPSNFYLYLLGKKSNTNKTEIKLLNASDLRNSLMLSFMNKLKDKGAIKTFLEKTINSESNPTLLNNLPILYKIIENLLIFYDLSREKLIFDQLSNFLEKTKLQTPEIRIYKDYFYLMQDDKYKINTEDWSKKKDLIQEAIKTRILFLSGRVNFEHLIENYKKIAELNKNYNFKEIKSLSEGSFSDFILMISLFIKSGYSDGLFIPKKEKIAYLEKTLGKNNIIDELIKSLEKDLFKIRIKSWEESLEKYTIVSFIPKNFIFRWITISILIPTILFFAIRKFYPIISYLYLGLFIGGSIIGGLLVYQIIKNNLKDSYLLK